LQGRPNGQGARPLVSPPQGNRLRIWHPPKSEDLSAPRRGGLKPPPGGAAPPPPHRRHSPDTHRTSPHLTTAPGPSRHQPIHPPTAAAPTPRPPTTPTAPLAPQIMPQTHPLPSDATAPHQPHHTEAAYQTVPTHIWSHTHTSLYSDTSHQDRASYDRLTEHSPRIANQRVHPQYKPSPAQGSHVSCTAHEPPHRLYSRIRGSAKTPDPTHHLKLPYTPSEDPSPRDQRKSSI